MQRNRRGRDQTGKKGGHFFSSPDIRTDNGRKERRALFLVSTVREGKKVVEKGGCPTLIPGHIGGKGTR